MPPHLLDAYVSSRTALPSKSITDDLVLYTQAPWFRSDFFNSDLLTRYVNSTGVLHGGVIDVAPSCPIQTASPMPSRLSLLQCLSTVRLLMLQP